MRMYLDDFFGVFVVVVFVWLLGRFGCPSGWVTYLPWSVVDDFGQQQQHSFGGGGVGM